MSLKFSSRRRRTSFLDPFNKFERTTREVEIRHDPLTGHVSRVVAFRLRELGSFDHETFIARGQARPCPFCPENLESMSARFTPDQVPGGRLSRGEATVFPNAFPYESMNVVTVLTHAHYLRPSQFTPRQIADALAVSREAFGKLAQRLAYASVNWNYMMPAGAGLVHPHFQLAAGARPTSFQAALQAKARAHARTGSGGGDLVTDYLAAETAAKVRLIGKLGPAVWLAPYAPMAIFDVMALFPGGQTLLELSAAALTKLGQGVCRVLAYLESKGVGAHNLALHTPLKPGTGLPMMLRLVSRADIPPMGIDEINYFEKLHYETITFLPPETMAEEIRAVWG
jgi:galactose-1-phosphate uridylyltransferase